MSISVDARGLACPGPVIATKKALEQISDGVVSVIVDNAVAKENVIKFAVSSRCGISSEERDGAFTIQITKGIPEATGSMPGLSTAYLITQDTLGQGSRELGAILMKSFFYTLSEFTPLPRSLLFINSGVQLTVDGSPVLPSLQALAAKGVDIQSCGTCLDYYHLSDKVAVGGITNMFTILAELNNGKAITV
jgi:selenium metabolism protein YedF